MKQLRQYIRRTLKEVISQPESSRKVYHVTNSLIDSLSPRPMWFWMDASLAHMLFDRNKEEFGNPYLYEGIVSGNIADTKDPVIRELLGGQDEAYDFIADLAGNPSETETMSFVGTKILLENGYDGVTFTDYHPADSQRDAMALIIFNTAKSVSDWGRIK